MRHQTPDGEGGTEEWLAIHEVYYASDDVDDLTVSAEETGYTENPVAPVGDNLDGLRDTLTLMLAALDKPVLEHK